ncbi:unnamed protein product, partial [Symbiodinium sp. KB8]
PETSTVNRLSVCKSEPHIWELDRHDVGAHCDAGTLLTQFAYTDCNGDDGNCVSIVKPTWQV